MPQTRYEAGPQVEAKHNNQGKPIITRVALLNQGGKTK
nr:MAG TPA: hypothetical protein [Caudoviricetes sp.]